MDPASEVRFLALLVHRGLVAVEVAEKALASGRPRAFLIDNGVIRAEQWEEWVATDAGRRPRLTRYRLGELLGEGGTARVFEAEDRKTGRTVALKVLKSELAGEARQVEQFVREAKLLLELDDEHIVSVDRVAREGEVFFFAMERIEGECLQDVLDRGEALDEEAAIDVVAQVADALDHLHARGLVHRDVKPGNIMRTAQGRAVLIDLGFAVRREQGGDTGTGTTAGTVHYIAPEQARGRGDLDVRADIYSLGATLYHLVTGSLPFAGGSSEEVLRKQVLESLSGERIRALGLSPQTHYFIEKMMAKEVEIRFQDPAQVVGELRTWLDRRRAARPTKEPRRPGPGRRRRRRLF